jgi:hypothetical protein
VIEDLIKKLRTKLSPIMSLVKKKGDFLPNLRQIYKFVPPGHFYSPIPSIDEIRMDEEKIFMIPDNIPGIDLNESEQIRMLDGFVKYYEEVPFESKKKANLRYFFQNEAYSYSDAIILYSMLRYAKPKRIIEIGSGYSSCVILDTNELFFNNSIQCTFIEPVPELLLSLIKENDRKRINLLPERLQDIEISEFSSLSEGDILFIDSSHVSKINSDVNYIFFQILPNISNGIYIHFHDIFYPFEYPKEWIYEGRAWTESYLLRAFLQYNNSFDIVYFSSFLQHFYKDYLKKEIPLCLKNEGGSIWIRKK